MGILDRYIAVIWARMLVICMGGFVSVYLVIDLIEKIPRFVRAGGAFVDIFSYFIWKIPEMVSRTATFSVLMATVLTLGLLSKDSEITAMRSCGVSVLRISVPMLALGLFTSLMLLINAELVLPVSYAHTEQIDRVLIKKKGERVKFKRNNIWFRSNSLILQAKTFDPALNTLRGVVLWDVDSSMNPLHRVDAASAVYRNGRWYLESALSRNFISPDGLAPIPANSVYEDLHLTVEDLQILDSDADNMSIRTLYEYAENLRRGGYHAYRYMTLLHTKIATPFAALIMVLLGIPFSLKSSRSSGAAMGVAASVGIGFAYYVLNAVLLSYGRSGVLPPFLAAWGANMMFASLGIWFSMQMKK